MNIMTHVIKDEIHNSSMAMVEHVVFPQTIEMIMVMHNVRDVADRQILPIRAYVMGLDSVTDLFIKERFRGCIETLPLDMLIRDIII